MASLIAPSSCMILFMSVALLVLQAHGATVQFTYCNPLDDVKLPVKKIDIERVLTPIGHENNEAAATVNIELLDCPRVRPKFVYGHSAIAAAFERYGKVISIVNETQTYEGNPIVHYLSKDWIARTVAYPGLYYQIVLSLPTGEVLTCVKIVEIPLI